MPDTTDRSLPYPICEQLSSKKLMMVPPQEAPTLDDIETAGHVDFWCMYTMRDVGPDRQYVDYEACHPGRGCFIAPVER